MSSDQKAGVHLLVIGTAVILYVVDPPSRDGQSAGFLVITCTGTRLSQPGIPGYVPVIHHKLPPTSAWWSRDQS